MASPSVAFPPAGKRNAKTKRSKPDEGEVQFVYIPSGVNGIPDPIPNYLLTLIGGTYYISNIGLEVTQPIGLEVTQPIGLEVAQPIGLEVIQPIGLEVAQPIGLEVGQPIGLESNVGGIRRLKNKALIRQPKTDNQQPIGLEKAQSIAHEISTKADAEFARKTAAEAKAAEYAANDAANDARQARVDRAYEVMWDIQLQRENAAATDVKAAEAAKALEAAETATAAKALKAVNAANATNATNAVEAVKSSKAVEPDWDDEVKRAYADMGYNSDDDYNDYYY